MNEVRSKILKGMLDVIVLGIVHEKPIHGYCIIKTIRKRYGVYFGASTIYPLLNELEKKGYIKSEWVFPQHKRKFGKLSNKPCKPYVITEKGKTMLHMGETELRLITVKSGLDVAVKPLIEVKASS